MIYQHVYKFWLLSLLDDYGNFKEAANHARMTQSAFSQNLKTLEMVFNKSLVSRGRGSVELSQDAKKLIETVRPILQSLDAIDPEAKMSSDLSGRFRLGAYESIAVHFLPHLFKSLQKKYPKLSFDVETSRTDTLVSQVRNGSLDVAIVIGHHEDDRLKSEELGNDELGIYVASDSEIDSLSNLGSQTIDMATLSPGSDGYPLYYQKLFKQLPDSFHVKIMCDSFETISGLILSGEMVGVLPNKLARSRKGKMKKLWPLDSEQSALGRHSFSIVSRKNIEQEVIEIIKQELTTVIENF